MNRSRLLKGADIRSVPELCLQLVQAGLQISSQRSTNSNLPRARGVECNLAQMKPEPAARKPFINRTTVERIADNRMARAREMYPNLVAAAGLGRD